MYSFDVSAQVIPTRCYKFAARDNADVKQYTVAGILHMLDNVPLNIITAIRAIAASVARIRFGFALLIVSSAKVRIFNEHKLYWKVCDTRLTLACQCWASLFGIPCSNLL